MAGRGRAGGPKDWTVIVLDVGKTMCDNGGNRKQSAISAAKLIVQEKLVLHKKDLVGIILVGSGRYNRNDYANIVEFGTWAEDSGEMGPASTDMLNVLVNNAPSETQGDVAAGISLAVDAIVADARYDRNKHQARVLVLTDGETAADGEVAQRAAKLAATHNISVDVLLIDPKHSNSAAVGDSGQGQGSSGDDADPSSGGGADGSQGHDGRGHRGRGRSRSRSRSTSRGRDGAGGHDAESLLAQKLAASSSGTTTAQQPRLFPVTATKSRTALILADVTAYTGGRLLNAERPADVLGAIAVTSQVSTPKPWAPLTLGGQAIAYISVYGLVMPAKPMTLKAVSDEGLRRAAGGAGEAGAEEGGEGEEGAGAPSAGGAQAIVGAAGVTRDTVYVRDLTDEEKAAAEAEGPGGEGPDKPEDLASREVQPEQVKKAYSYGKELVLVLPGDEHILQLPAVDAPEMEILAFVPLARIPRYYYMSNAYIMAAQQPAGRVKDEKMRVAGLMQLQALVDALAVQGKGALIRHRHNRSTAPTLFLGIPTAPKAARSAGGSAHGAAAAAGGHGHGHGASADPVAASDDVQEVPDDDDEVIAIGDLQHQAAAAGAGASAAAADVGAGSSRLAPGENVREPMTHDRYAGPPYEHPLPSSPLRDGQPAMILVQLPWNDDMRSEYIFPRPFTADPLGEGAPGVPSLARRTGPVRPEQEAAAAARGPAAYEAQLAAMDGLIDALDLTRHPSYGPQGFRPELNLNPRINAQVNALAARALDPAAPLPGPDPLILQYTDPRRVQAEAGRAFGHAVRAIEQNFELQPKEGSKLAQERNLDRKRGLASRQEALAGEEAEAGAEPARAAAARAGKPEFAEGGKDGGAGSGGGRYEEEEEPEDPNAPMHGTTQASQRPSKRARGAGDDDRGLLHGGLAGLDFPAAAGGPAVPIGTGRPVEDFRRAMTAADRQAGGAGGAAGGGPDPRFRAIAALAGVARGLADDDHELHVDKVLECVKELRKACLQHGYAGNFNSFLRQLRSAHGPTGGSTGRRVWRRVVQDGLTLISADETEDSDVTAAAAKAFLAGEAPAVAAPAPAPAPAPSAAPADDIEID